MVSPTFALLRQCRISVAWWIDLYAAGVALSSSPVSSQLVAQLTEPVL